MATSEQVEFGCVAATAGAPGASDQELYEGMLVAPSFSRNLPAARPLLSQSGDASYATGDALVVDDGFRSTSQGGANGARYAR